MNKNNLIFAILDCTFCLAALWLFDRNKKEAATNLLNEQLKIDPENITIIADLSRMLLKLGDNYLVNKYMENIRSLLQRVWSYQN